MLNLTPKIKLLTCWPWDRQHAHLQSVQSSARRGAKQQLPPATTASLSSQPPLFPYNPQPEDFAIAPQQDTISPTSRKRKAAGMQSLGGLSLPPTGMPPTGLPPTGLPPAGMGDPGGLVDPMDAMGDTMSSITAPKKSRTNTPWTPAEEQRLKTMRDAQNSWGEIAKVLKALQGPGFIVADSTWIQRLFPIEPKEVWRSTGTRCVWV